MKSNNRRLGGVRAGTAQRFPTEGTVRIGVAAGIPPLLRSLGVDPAEVLAKVGIDATLFADPDNRISYATRGRLLSQCVSATGCEHFGLLLGQQYGSLSAFGLVGFLVRNTPDAATALQSLVRFFHLHVRGAVTSLAVHGDLAILAYDIYQPRVEANDQIGDGAVATMFNIIGTLCGPDWKPIEVWLAHSAPGNIEPFRRFFRAPVRFDAEQNAILFSAGWLQRPVSGADPELRRMLQTQIDALDARFHDDFPEQVRSLLRTALLTGQAKADQIAALFSMHTRTLNRRLVAFGTNFQELVDEVRFEIALQMLEDSASDVSRIAALLDYADASAFTRAFRRWSGTTPSAWRAKRSAASGGNKKSSKRARA